MNIDAANFGSTQREERLSIKNLRYDVQTTGRRIRVLDDLNLEVQDGEFVVILGPSGCGKSTLIHLIAGLLEPDSGRITLDGEEITGPSTKQGIMFQDLGLFPWRTVRGNVQFGIENAGLPKDVFNERVTKLLRSVGMDGFSDFYPNQLSGGMAQRVALARTLAPAPKILLMDEPFRSLDAQTRQMMQEELLKLWEEEKRTILFVTHDVDEAVFLASRVVVLTARPAKVKEEFDIYLPRPRIAATRYRSDYLTTRNHILSSVTDETKIAVWANQYAASRRSDELWIGYIDTLAESLPLHVAMHKHLFEEHDVKVTAWSFDNGLKISSLMSDGELQGASVGPIAFLRALDEGVQVGAVIGGCEYATDSHRYSAICVKLGSDLKRVEDLFGKKVAVNGFETMGYAVVHDAVKKEGIFNSLEIVPLSFAEMIIALDQGAVDAAMLSEPYITPGLAEKKIDIFLDTDRFLPSALLSVIFLTKADDNVGSDRIRRFRAAYAQALSCISRDPDSVKQVLADLMGKTSDKFTNLKLPRWTDSLNITALESLLEPLARRGIIRKPDVVSQILTKLSP